MKKGKVICLLISVGVGLLICFFWLIGAFVELENKLSDYWFNKRGPISASKDIAIVAIDENSIKKLGRWPWPRNVHAEIIKKLKDSGARSVVFDVLFIEPDKDRPWADKELGKAARTSGEVIFGCFFKTTNSDGTYADLTLPVKALNSVRTGFVNVTPDNDGIFRKIPVVLEYEKKLIPSLALAGLSLYFNKEPKEILKERKVYLDINRNLIVNFSGGNETFPYYSFADVLEGKIASDNFRNKIVLVGGTATALFDHKPIPFSPVFYGVEVHANVMSNILLGNFFREWNPIITFFFIVTFALLSGLVLSNISPIKGGIAAVLAFAGYYVLVYNLFSKSNILAEFMAPGSALVFSYTGVLFYRFLSEEKEKRWVKKTFSHYLSAHVMESILADPSRLNLGGQRQDLSVLFSDIRGFTTLSEELNPEEVVELLNEYLSKMVETVFKYDGTLDKFIGDAIMAFWGAPIHQDDHPKRAVLCAIEMIQELKKLQEKWRQEGKKVIDIGIGISTGEMIVGNMGSKEKMEYTVIGDKVNLGSRLEGLNKEYKTHIIISDSTYNAVKDLVEAKPLGMVKVKGKEKQVEIYEIIGRKNT